MIIKTQDVGTVKIEKGDIIRFPQGIYAFEEVDEYVVLKNNADNPAVLRLQAVRSKEPRFIVVDPFSICPDYRPEVSEDVLRILQAKSVGELSLFAIAVIVKDVRMSTVNLKSPIVINFKTRLGMQVILDGSDYPIRYRLFPENGEEKEGSKC